jgi:hypothetical protein
MAFQPALWRSAARSIARAASDADLLFKPAMSQPDMQIRFGLSSRSTPGNGTTTIHRPGISQTRSA